MLSMNDLLNLKSQDAFEISRKEVTYSMERGFAVALSLLVVAALAFSGCYRQEQMAPPAEAPAPEAPMQEAPAPETPQEAPAPETPAGQ
jgi:hypothetical protein